SYSPLYVFDVQRDLLASKKCVFYLRSHYCSRTKAYVVYRTGSHLSATRSPPNNRLTRLMRLKIAEKLQETRFVDDGNDNKLFSFGLPVSSDGQIVIGDGSDEEPFLAGFSSPYLIRRLYRDPASFLLYFDATYKTNKVNYPLFWLRNRLKNNTILCSRWSRKCLTDSLGDHYEFISPWATLTAQVNAFESSLEEVTYLMCFFHFLEIVVKTLQQNLGLEALLCGMHFSKSDTESRRKLQASLDAWKSHHELTTFATYFMEQWAFSNCYQTRCGMAVTKNQKNRLIKDVVTLRERLSLGTLTVETLTFVHLASLRRIARAD
ncbi:TPA: LOW QUALITY PROTEIN: hypothetical protein N0F65_009905, partial [Lagenidium giganteum]